jgi:type III secretion protein J
MNPATFLKHAALLLPAIILAGCKTEVDLHGGLSDGEANRVVSALRDDGVAAKKRAGKEGVTVSVPEGDLARSTAVLQARGLPHRAAARMGDVFKKEGLISSPLEERARYVYALSQELEATLGEIDGVVVARVHVVLPEKVAPGEPLQPPSAAVFIKHLRTLEPDVVGLRVRQLVARSIPGMGAQAIDRVSAVFVVSDGVPGRPVEPADASHWSWGIVGVSSVASLLFAVAWAMRAAARRRRAARAEPVPEAAPAAGTGTATAA